MRGAHPNFVESFRQDMNLLVGSINARTIRYQTRLKNALVASTKKGQQ